MSIEIDVYGLNNFAYLITLMSQAHKNVNTGTRRLGDIYIYKWRGFSYILHPIEHHPNNVYGKLRDAVILIYSDTYSFHHSHEIAKSVQIPVCVIRDNSTATPRELFPMLYLKHPFNRNKIIYLQRWLKN